MALQNLSGVSWLRDRILKDLTERREDLKEKLSNGVPMREYGNYVGRCKELERILKITLPEIFETFESDPEEDDE